jgi:hypothetical protein
VTLYPSSFPNPGGGLRHHTRNSPRRGSSQQAKPDQGLLAPKLPHGILAKTPLILLLLMLKTPAVAGGSRRDGAEGRDI